MSLLVSAFHDAIRAKIRGVLTILVSLLALAWLLGWIGLAPALGLPVWSPAVAVQWAVGVIGYRDPDWLNMALIWLHNPSRRDLLIVVAMAAGVAASGTALRWGPLRNGLGAEVAWALLLPAIEGLGSRPALRWAIGGFALLLALALLCWIASWPWVPRSRRQIPRRWSLLGIGRGLWLNIIEFIKLPMLVPTIIYWLLAAYRDDSAAEPVNPGA
jgi:hypothetical protein